MKKLLSVVLALAALLAMPAALAGRIGDIGISAYPGADGHGAGDVIGVSRYDIDGAAIAHIGSVLTVALAPHFAGDAGADPWVAQSGIGYGELSLSKAWNPFRAGANRINDGVSYRTASTRGARLDNQLGNRGGTSKLYQLNDAANASPLLNADSFIAAPPVPHR